MEVLKSLAELLTRQKLYQAELIDEATLNQSKVGDLYHYIVNGKISSDQDAYSLIYDGQEKPASLKKLKSRLYDKMINSIFFIDQSGPNYKDLFLAAKSCYKNYAAIRLLWGNRKNDVGADLAEKTIKISIKYEFTDLNFLLSSLLCTYYLTFTRNFKKYEKYKNLKEYYLEALFAESTAEELYGSLGIDLSKSSSGLSDEQLNFYSSKLSFLVEKRQSIKTTRFNLHSFLFQANLLLELKNYEQIISLADEGMAFYKSKGIKSSDAEYFLRTRAAVASFLLKKYQVAENLYKQNLQITGPSTSNWYATYNFYFALNIIQEKYLESYEIISKIFNTKEFEKRAHPMLVQLYKIKEAYIHFLVQLGKIDPSKSTEAPLRKFRLNRFLNDVPTYSKDKRGANISILIIQMLLLVQNKKYNQVIDKLDSLNMYSHRYLRSDNTFRSNCFIKMLAKLPDADYHPIRWQRYVKKFRDRLDEHPFELSYHNLDLEVIPFETLYDLVVEMLERLKK